MLLRSRPPPRAFHFFREKKGRTTSSVSLLTSPLSLPRSHDMTGTKKKGGGRVDNNGFRNRTNKGERRGRPLINNALKTPFNLLHIQAINGALLLRERERKV